MPNRSLKESIRTSKKVNSLSDIGFRVWAYLITYVDDFGRGSADPEILHGLLFPKRKKKVTETLIKKALREMEELDMIRTYESDGDPYLFFPNWEEHQKRRASKSKFPDPPQAVVERLQTNVCNCQQMSANVPDNDNDNEYDNDIRISNNDNDNENDNGADTDADVIVRDDTDRAKVLKAFCGRINATPSEICLAELEAFTEALGPEVCIRAMDIAIDAKKANWNYIRGILRNAKQRGVTCLADFEALDQQHQEQAAAKKYGKQQFASARISKDAINEVQRAAVARLIGEAEP